MRLSTLHLDWRKYNLIFFSITTLGLLSIFPVAAQAEWQEPTCDPSVDPNNCNISAPINVSSVDQAKSGALRIDGDLVAGAGFKLEGGLTITSGSLSLPQDSIIDDMVSNTLTASGFERVPGTAAVDLSSWDLSDPSNAEVVGTLDIGAVGDNWVDEIGDAMSGSLFITGHDTNQAALDIDLTGTGVNDEYGLSIVSNTTNADNNNAFPIFVDVQGSAARGIYVQTQATSGTGVYSYAFGSGGRGVYSVGTQNGVYAFGSGDSATGVTGHAVSDNSIGVHGLSTGGTNVYGVKGESITGTGIYGESFAPETNMYGITGCKNGYCGSLGTNTLAAYFTHDVLTEGTVTAQQFLETKDQTFGPNSYYPGQSKRTITPRSTNLVWDYVRWSGNDGDEVWMIVDNNSNKSEIIRVDAQTGRIITVNTLGGSTYPFFDGVITEDSFITIQGGTSAFDAGKIWQWDRAYADIKSSCPTSPSSCGNEKLHNITTLGYDGTYLWAGRSVGGLGSADSILRFEYNGNWSYSITGTSASHFFPLLDEVIDFEIDSQYTYALVQKVAIDSPSEPTKTQIYQLDGPTNNWLSSWELPPEYKGTDMVFDGRNLWITYESTDGKDGLAQIDLKDPSSGGPIYYYDLHTSFAQFDQPNSITFDGEYLWIGLSASNSITRVIPLPKGDHESLEIAQDKFYTVGQNARLLQFDGEHIWTASGGAGTSETGRLNQIISGRSYGTSGDSAASGITLYDAKTTSATPYCLRVETGVLKIVAGVCPVK